MHILKWNQVGRTMLEIISVMAIIGILSVTGIYMYQTAMVSLRANDVIEEGSKKFASRSEKTNRTTVVVTSRAQKRTAYGYGLSDAEVDSSCDNRIMVSVGAVNSGDRSIDTDVCMKLLSSVGENMPIKGIYLKDECTPLKSEFCTQSEKISMLRFEFASSSSFSGSSTPDVYCQAGTYNPNCQICDEAARKITDKANSCQTCDPESGDISNDYNPACQTCDLVTGEKTNIDPLPPGCISCADGFGVQDRDNDSVYSPTCPQNSYIELNSDGETGCCKACPDGRVTNGIDAVIENGGDPNDVCLVAITEECPNEKPLTHESGNCYSCEWVRNLKLKSGVNSFEICSNLGQATRIDENGLSVLACLSHIPLRDKNGQCWPCDTHEQINVEGVEEYCNVCNGVNDTSHHKRGLSQLFNNSDYQYEPRNPKRDDDGSGSYCNFKCPDDKPLLYKWQCYSCGDSSLAIGHWSDKIYDCEAICDGRDNGPHLKRRYVYDEDSVCARACPDDKPIIDSYGDKCHSCDETGNISHWGFIQKREPCESICDGSNTTSRAKRVLRTYCSPVCPENKLLQTYWDRCHSCDDFKASDSDTWYMRTASAVADCAVCDGSDNTIHKKRRLINKQYCMQECPAGQLLATPTDWTDRPSTFCHSCDEKGRIYLGKDRASECTAVCPNRYMDDNGYCNFSCPDDKPILGLDGECYACNSSVAGINIGNSQLAKDSCAKCPNRHYNYRLCALPCPESSPLEISPFPTQNYTFDKYCKRCDDSAQSLGLYNGDDCTTYCNGSDNGIHKLRQRNGNSCMACPEDKTIMGGGCHSCDEPNEIRCYGSCSGFEKCDGTNNTTRAKRMFGKNTRDASGKYWSKDISYSCLNRPLNDRLDGQGYCQPCNFNGPIPDKEGETLAACPGERFLSGNYSYPCATAERGPTGLGNNSLQCGECGGSIETVNGQRTCVF
ncbi:MAG: hypothetical protein E7021_03135 [Alphaproteobacteria bacterium]|nr:hypothetical protein [Alphaproteobacteria bacterium]